MILLVSNLIKKKLLFFIFEIFLLWLLYVIADYMFLIHLGQNINALESSTNIIPIFSEYLLQKEIAYFTLFALGFVACIILVMFIKTLSRNLTDIYHEIEEIKSKPTFDITTNTGNKIMFNYLVELNLGLYKRYQRDFSIAMVQLVDYNLVYSLKGRVEANMLLDQVESVFKERLRDTDLLFKLNDDTFGIVFSDTKPFDVHPLLTNLLESAMKIVTTMYGNPIKLSAGIEGPDENPDTSELLTYRCQRKLASATSLKRNIII